MVEKKIFFFFFFSIIFFFQMDHVQAAGNVRNNIC